MSGSQPLWSEWIAAIQVDAQADLLARVKELEGELEREQQDHQALVNEVMRVEEVRLAQLHQRDTALVECRNALVKFDYSFSGEMLDKHGCLIPLVDALLTLKPLDHALSQIQEVKP